MSAKDFPASVATCLQQLSLETDEPKATVKNDQPDHQVKTSELSQLTFGCFGSGMNGFGQPTSFPSQSLCDDSEEIDEPKASVKDGEPNHQQVQTSELSHLMFGRFGSGMNGSGQPSSSPSQSFNDDSEDTPDFSDDLSLKYLITR